MCPLEPTCCFFGNLKLSRQSMCCIYHYTCILFLCWLTASFKWDVFLIIKGIKQSTVLMNRYMCYITGSSCITIMVTIHDQQLPSLLLRTSGKIKTVLTVLISPYHYHLHISCVRSHRPTIHIDNKADHFHYFKKKCIIVTIIRLLLENY